MKSYRFEASNYGTGRTLDLGHGQTWHYGPPPPVRRRRTPTAAGIWFGALGFLALVTAVVIPPVGITILALVALRLVVRRGC